jgi:Acetyltransferase (GNAT) domain
MSGVRSLTGSDIDQVAELHNRVFLQSRPMTPQLRQRYRQWLETVFLNNQARLPGYDSLVYEHEGSVVGFIGVAGRRFTLLGQTYPGTLHSNFVVHPAHPQQLQISPKQCAAHSAPADLGTAGRAR